jgi:hypothetical protein
MHVSHIAWGAQMDLNRGAAACSGVRLIFLAVTTALMRFFLPGSEVNVFSDSLAMVPLSGTRDEHGPSLAEWLDAVQNSEKDASRCESPPLPTLGCSRPECIVLTLGCVVVCLAQQH